MVFHKSWHCLQSWSHHYFTPCQRGWRLGKATDADPLKINGMAMKGVPANLAAMMWALNDWATQTHGLGRLHWAPRSPEWHLGTSDRTGRNTRLRSSANLRTLSRVRSELERMPESTDLVDPVELRFQDVLVLMNQLMSRMCWWLHHAKGDVIRHHPRERATWKRGCSTAAKSIGERSIPPQNSTRWNVEGNSF